MVLRRSLAVFVTLVVLGGVVVLAPPPFRSASAAAAYTSPPPDPFVGFERGLTTVAGGGDPATTVRGCETYGSPPSNCAASGSDNDVGYAARFDRPFDVGLSPDESTLFVSDTYNSKVRQIDLATGAVTDCTSVAQPTWLAAAPSGDIYVKEQINPLGHAEEEEARIVRVPSGCGTPEVFADNLRNIGDFVVDGSTVWAGISNEPWWSQSGGVYPLDAGNTYDGINSLPTPIWSWGAGSFKYATGIDLHPDGSLYVTREHTFRIDTATGQATEVSTLNTHDIQVGPDGLVYQVRQGSCPNGSHVVTATADFETFDVVAGDVSTGDFEDGSAGLLCNPWGMVMTADGSTIYIADTSNHAIRKVGLRPSGADLLRWIEEHFGLAETMTFFADPVSAVTGSLTEAPEPDLAFPEVVYGLDWSRVYNSMDAAAGGLGRGWITRYESSLRTLTTGECEARDVDPCDWVRFRMPDGRIAYFDEDDQNAGVYTAPEGVFAELAVNGSGDWEIDWFNGELWTFDESDGRLLGMEDRTTEQTVTVNWSSGEIATVVSSTGHGLDFDYSGGRVDRVTATPPSGKTDGRYVEYAYGDDGDLNSVGFGDGDESYPNVVSYTTDWAGRITDIFQRVDATQVDHTIHVDYGEMGRVVAQDIATEVSLDVGPGDRAEIDYDDSNRESTITHFGAAGTADDEQFTFEWDGHGRITDITDSKGEAVTRNWDQGGGAYNGRLGSLADRRGNEWTPGFDFDRGRLEDLTLPEASGGPSQALSYASSTDDRPTTVTRRTGASSTLQWAISYPGGSGPFDRVPDTIDGPGSAGVTDVDEHGTAKGLVGTIIDPDGVATTGNANDYKTTYDYDAARNLVSATVDNDTGTSGTQTTTLAYDGAGRLTSVTTPLGHVTTYEWDARNRLVKVTDPEAAVSTAGHYPLQYGYDDANRLVWVSDQINPDSDGPDQGAGDDWS